MALIRSGELRYEAGGVCRSGNEESSPRSAITDLVVGHSPSRSFSYFLLIFIGITSKVFSLKQPLESMRLHTTSLSLIEPNFRRSLLLTVLLLSGCALTQELSRTPRTAVEQLLLTQAVERSLQELALPLPAHESVVVEATGLQTDRAHMHKIEDEIGVIDGPSWDLSFVRDTVAARLGELGYHIRKRDEEAGYLVRIIVQALGTTQGKTFFGMPPIQSVLLPFALPELTFYKEQDQTAYV